MGADRRAELSRKRIITGRRLAFAAALLVVWALAAPICLLQLGANPPPPPQAYRSVKDAAISLLWPLWLAEITPCTQRDTADGIVVRSGLSTDQCFKMQPQRRFKGIWLDEFEGSRFLEGVTGSSEALARLQRTERNAKSSREWLETSAIWRDLPPSLRQALEPSEKPRLVYVEFDGRRTAYRGRYGHLGMSESEIIVDRVISAHVVYQSRFEHLACEAPAQRSLCE